MRYVTIFLMMFVIPAFAQSSWIEQHAVGLPASDNPTLYLATVNSNICWGIQVDVLNPKCVLTVDGGQNWDILSVPGISDLSAGSIAAVDDKTAWIAVDDQSGTNSGIFKTIDGGINWERKGTAFSNGGHPRILYFFDANNGLCIGNPRNYGWEIYITNDAGETWIEIHNSKIPGISAPGDMTFGSISAASGDNFWFGTFWRSIYKSTDKGQNWTVDRDIPVKGGVAVDPVFKDPFHGIACSFFGEMSNKISKTESGGGTWNSLIAPPSHPSLYFISYVPGNNLYVSTSHNNIGAQEPTTPGSMYTIDGETWVIIDDIPRGPASFTSDGSGWCSGLGDIIYKWNGAAVDVKENILTEKDFSLSQNYPNPFNPSTTINYSIPSQEFVTLKIYDMLGKEAATLVSEVKNSGSYKVDFNGTNLSSGIYMYKLRAGKNEQTKKFIFMK